jgi:hypothetical protein
MMVIIYDDHHPLRSSYVTAIFRYSHLPLQSSSIKVIFHSIQAIWYVTNPPPHKL